MKRNIVLFLALTSWMLFSCNKESEPIEVNDLREVFKDILGEVKIYPKGYAYAWCPEHDDHSPSLLITKEWFSCSSCNFKGNIFTLKKLGYVEFGRDGVVR